MKKERLNPLNDYLFMKYMGEKGDEEQLLGFLNAVLQRTGRDGIVAVDIKEDKTFTADIIGNKTGILDVRAITQEGVRVNIEVQLRNAGDMDRRSLFYRCREYALGIKSGHHYRELPQVIAINIIDFDFIPVNEAHTSFHLWEDKHKDIMLTDALEIHFISMVKFRQLKEKDIENSPLHRWLAFLDKNTDETTVKKIIEMDTAIKKAQERIAFVSCDEETLRVYQRREMAMFDYASGMDYATRKGREEGRQEGEAIGKQKGEAIGKQKGEAIGKQKGEQTTTLKHILSLSSKNKSTEEISDLLDLPIEYVRDVLNNRPAKEETQP